MAFRGNFLVKVSVEVLWLGILLAFYRDGLRQDEDGRRLARGRSTSSSSAASSP